MGRAIKARTHRSPDSLLKCRREQARKRGGPLSQGSLQVIHPMRPALPPAASFPRGEPRGQLVHFGLAVHHTLRLGATLLASATRPSLRDAERCAS
ncbi:hypothetical protein MTO96_006930 [Rhipicephalus appendiculatus]